MDIHTAADGEVALELENGSSKIKINLTPEMLAQTIAKLCSEAQAAMRSSGAKPYAVNESVPGLMGVNPTAIGILLDTPSGKTALLVHAGRSRFGIGVSDRLRGALHRYWREGRRIRGSNGTLAEAAR